MAKQQTYIWTIAGILLIGPLGTNFSEIFIEICMFSLNKMCYKMSSGKWRPFCLVLIVLMAKYAENKSSEVDNTARITTYETLVCQAHA